MLGNRRFVGETQCGKARSAKLTRQWQVRQGAYRLLTPKKVRAGPPGLAQFAQARVVDISLVKKKTFGGQAVEMGRGHPGVAVTTQKAGV